MILLVFIGLSVISVLGILLMFLLKNETHKKTAFYLMTVLGIVAAWMNATSIPRNLVGEQILAWGLGALSILAILLQLLGKGKKEFTIAQILVVISVLGSIFHLFLI